MFSSARIRLTLWYAGVFGVVLLLFSVGVYEVSEAALLSRVDAAVRSLAEAAEVALRGETEEGESLQLAAQSTVTEINLLPQEAIAVFTVDGQVLAERGAIRAEQMRPALVSTSSAEVFRSHRLSVRSVSLPDRRYQVVVSHALSSVYDDLAVLRQALIAAVPAGVAIAGLAGWFLAQKALHPIKVMFGQQRQFMADASHELRTPVSVIVGAAEVALDQPQREEDEYRDALTMIHQEGQRLRRSVEDMFTLARADAGQLTVQLAPIYLDEVVADAARAARVLAAGKDVRVDLTGDADLRYTGDESMLRRLVLNLLDNAVRHSPRGGRVEVAIESRPTGYTVRVKDSGDGIPLDAQPLIFTRFYQGDTARTHDVLNGRGAGLGLPIARCVAEAHNGSLELLDSSDRGSTFIVTLPYDASRAG